MAQSSNQISAAEAAVAAHYGLLLGIQSPWQVQRADLDLGGRRVLDVVPGRDTASATQLWATLPAAQRQQVTAVAIDMSDEFATATHLAAPQAAIGYDRCHVAKHRNEAVDKVRRDEHHKLLQQGDDSLTRTKYLWLQGACPDGERGLSFADLCARNLKTARAWVHKETFVEFWAQPELDAGRKFFSQWFPAARRSKLDPIKKVALTLKNPLSGLLTSFL